MGLTLSARRYSGRLLAFGISAVALIFPLSANVVLARNADVHERFCPDATAAVSAFYGELNAGKAKDMMRLADKGELAAVELRGCAQQSRGDSRIENDILRIRAADALFIAAEARSRLRQHDLQKADLRAVLALIRDLDETARNSNEHVYREARLLELYAHHTLRTAVR